MFEGKKLAIANFCKRSNQQGSITAFTTTGRGGNINLNVDDIISLSSQSLINAESLVTGDGGNIDIQTSLIVGLANSRINANAFEGTGGNITITTQGLFLSPDSQITASSEFGVDGVVAINNPDTDQNVALLELPKETTDPSQQISQGCEWVRDNSFIVTGRGGIPKNPTNNYISDQMWSDIRYLSENQSSEIEANGYLSEEHLSVVVEANAMIVNEQGNVELVALIDTENILPVTNNCSSQAYF